MAHQDLQEEIVYGGPIEGKTPAEVLDLIYEMVCILAEAREVFHDETDAPEFAEAKKQIQDQINVVELINEGAVNRAVAISGDSVVDYPLEEIFDFKRKYNEEILVAADILSI